MSKILFLAGIAAALYWAWRNASVGSGMSVTEARRILEIEDGADPERILAAHRRLIAKVHPDSGGTAELAARVNQARDVLLKRTIG
ncbi:MAG: hypothetical protein RIS52_1196 [Pseudomonadota bacterium]|jgi:DnaJ homolog subfamily C member 19